MSIRFSYYGLITNADMSASFMSEAIDLSDKSGFSIDSVFTGSPDGTMYIAVSIDNVEWRMLPDSSTSITEAGDVLYNVNDAKYLWARLHFVANFGSVGVLNSTYSRKGGV
jgi:hypothetical protein